MLTFIAFVLVTSLFAPPHDCSPLELFTWLAASVAFFVGLDQGIQRRRQALLHAEREASCTAAKLASNHAFLARLESRLGHATAAYLDAYAAHLQLLSETVVLYATPGGLRVRHLRALDLSADFVINIRNRALAAAHSVQAHGGTAPALAEYPVVAAAEAVEEWFHLLGPMPAPPPPMAPPAAAAAPRGGAHAPLAFLALWASAHATAAAAAPGEGEPAQTPVGLGGVLCAAAFLSAIWAIHAAAKHGFGCRRTLALPHSRVLPTALVGRAGPISWAVSGNCLSFRGPDGHARLAIDSHPGEWVLFVTPWARLSRLPIVTRADGAYEQLSARVAYGPLRWRSGPVVEPQPCIRRYEELAYMADPRTDSLYAKRDDSERTVRIPLGAFWAAQTRYRLATSPNYGIVTMLLNDHLARDEEAMAIALRLTKAHVVGDAWRPEGRPDCAFAPTFLGISCSDMKTMADNVVCNVLYAPNDFGHGMAMGGAATEIDTINRRITGPASDYVGSQQMWAYAEEFLAYVCTRRLFPADHDRVVGQMNRPSQRANRSAVDTVFNYLPSFAKRTFIKLEAVLTGKPARNICTVSPQRLYRAAAFTLPASDHMQTFKWWVWGIGSGATARAFHAMARESPKLQESDFSKFDASLGPFFVEFNRKFMTGLFGPNSGWEVLEQDAIVQSCVATSGTRYLLKFGRMSGVNETTLFNTLDQAFIQYASFRQAKLNRDRAIETLEKSLLGGDDGVVPFVGQDLAATSAEFGMKVELRVFDATTPCRFLGRVYYAPAITPDSTGDIGAFLTTIHLVNRGAGLLLEQALVNQAYGLSVTDGGSPVFHEFCAAVKRAYPSLRGEFNGADDWWARHYSMGDPFPNESFTSLESVLPWYAAQMRTAPEDIVAVRDWLANNKFYVGSVLPRIATSCLSSSSKAAAFIAQGLSFGSLETPPELPAATAAEKAAAHALVARAHDEASGVECHRCGATGHIARDCPEKQKCNKCGKTGHQARRCTQTEEDAARVRLDADVAEILSDLGVNPAPKRGKGRKAKGNQG